jgi:8-oxo-dGTP diphosphatase
MTGTPGVELRVASLTLAGGCLFAFANETDSGFALPKGPPIAGEGLDETATGLIRSSLGFAEQYIEQLYTLSHPIDNRWSIIVSYLALVCTPGDMPYPHSGRWIGSGSFGALADSDRRVMDYALFRLRAKLGYTTIAFHLMPPTFTLSELQTAFEVILGRDLDKRNFRRRMATLGILAPTRETRRDGSHRPARLYRFLPDRDPTDYLTPPWASSKPGEAQ